MPNSQLPLQAYRTIFERWLAAGDDLLAREELLLEVSELGKALVRQRGSTDELMSLHHQTQALIAEGLREARPGTPAGEVLQRLASGDALALMLALLLPGQLDAQRRAAQAEEGLRQNDKLRAVATLAAGVAHDFNNLLGSIIGLAELCELQAAPGSAQARNLAGILQASRHAAGLVGQLLSFAREAPLQRRPVQVAELLARSQALLAAGLPRGQVLQLQVLADARVEVDPMQIEQLLLNLVKNAGQALQAARAGQVDQSPPQPGAVVQLLADLAPADEQLGGQPTARLRVIDHGPGIPAEVLPRIFEPFFTTKEVGEGTGLGLASAHGIARHHGGALTVRSQPGVETVFSLRLPVLADAPAPAAAGG